MPKQIGDGVEIKLTIPRTLHSMLRAESQEAGVAMADLVRLALAQRYRALADADAVRRDPGLERLRRFVRVK